MNFLLLWSGDMYAMRKATVPSVPANLVGYPSPNGPIMPCRDAIRAALPKRYRAMLDRAHNFWFDAHHAKAPCALHLRDTRGKLRHVLYLQPLSDTA